MWSFDESAVCHCNAQLPTISDNKYLAKGIINCGWIFWWRILLTAYSCWGSTVTWSSRQHSSSYSPRQKKNQVPVHWGCTRITACCWKQQYHKLQQREADQWPQNEFTKHDASVLWHCWLGNRKGIRPVKNWMLVNGDDLTGALHDLQLQLSPPPSSSVASQ